MGSKQKILKYLDFKGVSQGEFNRICSFSESFLRKGDNIGTDKVKIILENYTDLSVDWLVLDRGNMLLSDDNVVKKHRETNDISYQTKLSELREKHIKIHEELLEAHKTILAITKTKQSLKKL